MSDENPFASSEIENPFADPAVQRATAAAAAASGNSKSLEDYDPFNKTITTGPAVMQPTMDQQQQPNPPPPTTASVPPPAPVPAPSAAPPPYTQSGAQHITPADFQELQRRQEELERRARELERREEELKNSPYNARQNNWPPLPTFLPIQPCFYQDINVDIPVEFQQIVRYLYYLWIWHVSFLFCNMFVGLCYLFAGGDSGGTFALGLIYFLIFTPASFVCWFRPAYKAFRNDSSINFMVFFFVFFFQAIISVIYTMGVGNMGACGLILAIGMLKGTSGGQIFVGLLMLLTTIGFGIAAAADIFLLLRVHRLYRRTGASMAKAQAEFASGVMNSEQVRQAAAEAAAAGVRSQFASAGGGGQQQQQQQPQQQAGGFRY